MSLASCIYLGTVQHRRLAPVVNAFRYRVFMLYIDLAEVDAVFAGRLLWSARRPAFARWRRSDHPGDPRQPLDAWVRDLVAERTGARPSGPVRLLTHLRYGGVGFNPISVYYCFADGGEDLEWAVLEVTNTPWHERTHYVLDLRSPGDLHAGRLRKAMHVSPFLPMDLEYRWRLTEPGATVSVAFDVVRGTETLLCASVSMRRRELSTWSMAAVLVRYPPMSLRVIGGIHRQAFRLWRRGVPYHRHPRHHHEEHAAA